MARMGEWVRVGFWVLGGARGWRAVAEGSDGKLSLRAKVEKAELMVTEGWGGGLNERVTSRKGGSVLGWGSYRVSDVSLRGEQLYWGAATLPTLSSLSRINDGVRIHECAGLLIVHTHMHTLPSPHTISMSDLYRRAQPLLCHIYPQQCGGEGRLLLVSNKRVTSEWEEAKHSLISPLQRPLWSLSPPCLTLNEVDKC